jgi:hypothetical protein
MKRRDDFTTGPKERLVESIKSGKTVRHCGMLMTSIRCFVACMTVSLIR